MMANPVVHFEIGCRDLAATGSFYSELFGWSISPMGPAAMIAAGSDKGIAGHIASLGHEPHQYTIFYIEVEDIAAALAKAESLGGKKLVGPVPIPTGSFAWFADPGGNTVGLLQSKS